MTFLLRFFTLLCLFSCLSVFAVVGSSAAEPCQSGLQPGQKPGPYTFVVSTGPQRGQLYCYICETADRPAVVVFARSLSEPLAKLARGLDRAMTEHKSAGLRCWVTFLHDDQPALDPKVVQWGQQHAIRSVPLGVFEDANGPPAYRLAREAEVTVLLFVKQKVIANFAFRAGELTDEKVAEVLQTVPKLVEKK
jgi:hypothetical protein